MGAGDGIARFAADLPAVDRFVSLGEGGTPVLPLANLARQWSLPGLTAKLESLNPTGSYKDRVAAMSLSLARQHGYRGWIATSSGNAGLAFAAYGARAGLPGFLCMVSPAPAGKRIPLLPYRIGLVAVEGVGQGGDRAAAAELMATVRAAAERHRLFLGITAHAYNPEGMRGIDTLGYELAAQAPDATHVYVPTGGGGLVAAVARGLAHSGSRARVISCQPAGCAPIVRHLAGELADPVVDRCETGISALQLPDPPDATLAVEAVRRSGGWGTAVGDDQILAAQRLLAGAEGVFVEPAAATTVAAVRHDLDRGRLDRQSRPVLLLTGAGWKDLDRFAEAAAGVPTVRLPRVAGRIDEWADGWVHDSAAAAASTAPTGTGAGAA